MPVSLTAKAITERARLEASVVAAPARGGADGSRSVDRALLGELEGVGEQVLEDLLQPLGVGVHGAGRPGSSSISNSSVLDLGDVPEGALHVVA